MIKKIKSGSGLFYENPRDKDFIIITDEDITHKDLEQEKGVDKYVHYTHKENSLERTFFTIMAMRLQNLTDDPIYLKERPKLREALYDEFRNKIQRENSKLSWWYLLALEELEGTLDSLTNDDIKDIVKRSKEFELTDEEKNKLIAIHELVDKGVVVND